VTFAVRGTTCITAYLQIPWTDDDDGTGGTVNSATVKVLNNNWSTISVLPSSLLGGEGVTSICGEKDIVLTVFCDAASQVPAKNTPIVSIAPYGGVPPSHMPTRLPTSLPSPYPHAAPTVEWYEKTIDGAEVFVWLIIIFALFLIFFAIGKTCRGKMARKGLWPSEFFACMGCGDETCDAFWDSAPFCCFPACYDKGDDPREGSLVAARQDLYGGGYFGSNPKRSRGGRKKDEKESKKRIAGMGMKDAYHIRRRELILEALPFASGGILFFDGYCVFMKSL
jgi:hypothetical protein